MSQSPPPIVDQKKLNSMEKVGSYEVAKPSNSVKKYAHKPEPQMSRSVEDPEKASPQSSPQQNPVTDEQIEEIKKDVEIELEDSYTPDEPIMTTQMTSTKSDFQIKMEERRSEILREKQKLAQLQQNAFEQQVAVQQSKSYKRLYDVWEEYATNEGTTMDIHGVTKALAVFGMIIDTDKDFQRHIFRKFDLDNEKEITYNDFSATIASFVGSNTDDDALQTLFEIFDIDQDGYLELEDMARVLLAQNQITIVVTGQQSSESSKNVVYSKQQCLKQARRMVAEYDSEQFNDNKISFDEFKAMMNQRTENDMMIAHMQAPSESTLILEGDGNENEYDKRKDTIPPMTEDGLVVIMST